MANQMRKLLSCLQIQLSEYYFKEFQKQSRCIYPNSQGLFLDENESYIEDHQISSAQLNRKKETIIRHAFLIYEDLNENLDTLKIKLGNKSNNLFEWEKQHSLNSSRKSLKPLSPQENPYKIPMDEHDFGMGHNIDNMDIEESLSQIPSSIVSICSEENQSDSIKFKENRIFKTKKIRRPKSEKRKEKERKINYVNE